jgi:hypothetical protein
MLRRFLAVLLALVLVPGVAPLPLHAQEPATSVEREARVAGSRVNVRAEPGLHGRILYQVSRGDVLRVVEEAGEWLLVVPPDGEPGYISRALVELLAPREVPPPTAVPPTPPEQEPPSIAHDPLVCVLPGENPEVAAGVTSPAEVKRSRVYFKAHQHPDWYYIDMTALEIPEYLALLPQPLPETQKVDYYVHALDTMLLTTQTEQYEPMVSRDRACKRRPAMAKPGMEGEIVIGGTIEGQPPIPPGFSPKGIVAFVTVAGAMITGAALASGGTAAGGGSAAGGAAGAGASAGAGGGISALTIGLIAAGAGAGAVALAAGGGDDSSDPQDPGDGREQQPGTGDVAFRLTWRTAADLDLYVQEPNGNVIYFANRQSSTGGILDVDSNAGCTTSQPNPVENIFWSVGRAPRGQYIYWVIHYGCGPASAFTLQVLRGTGGSVVASHTGTLQPNQESAHFSYTF